MFDPGQRRGPMTTDEKWFSGIFLALILGLFAAEIMHDFHPAKLSARPSRFSGYRCWRLHECGHALAAKLLGWELIQVVIGMGRLVGRFRWGVPSSSFACCRSRDSSGACPKT